MRVMSAKKKAKPSLKKNKLAANLERTLLQYLKGKKYVPSTWQELSRHLSIAEVHIPLFKELLNALEKKGEIILSQKKYSIPSLAPLVTGTISVHAKGFGFVRNPNGPDIFIPKHFLKEAVDGDTVEVQVNPVVSAKGPEGVVVAIVQRNRTHLAGTIVSKTGRHYIAFSPLLGPSKPMKVKSKTPLKEGDRIICKISQWKNDSDMPEGEMSSLIGHISDPSVDIKAATLEFNLSDDFTLEAIEEAKAFGNKLDTQGRKDLTSWEIVTIDPDTAKDFDDAISLTKDKKGHFHLGVHIADVSHYVKPGSHLDKEAISRCNSTYFPGKCVPMLPEELSNELCSLKPKVIRLTQSILAEFSPSGDLINYEILRTFIKSQKRFTYREALAILERKKKSKHAPLLERMVDLCNLLKKKRFERGSIDFSMPDNVIIVRVEYDITHQMIEEFMLKANEIAARHLAKEGKSVIYRIHEQPSEESFQDFFTFARSLGFILPPKPTHRDIQQLFLNAKDSPFLSQLSISFIRSMRLAAYSADNLGHYGLALDHYCHFTSPIRRYTDLIIQRLLFNELPESTNIEQIAASCSEKERISFKAESSVVLLKKLRLAGTYFKEDPTRVYHAHITKIKPFAVFFEVPLFDLEGTLHVSKIGNDYYEYNPTRMSFRGSRTGKTFSIGQQIFVRLDNLNYILMQSEWSIISEPITPAKKGKRKQRKGT
jgi:ribonuclease R